MLSSPVSSLLVGHVSLPRRLDSLKTRRDTREPHNRGKRSVRLNLDGNNPLKLCSDRVGGFLDGGEFVSHTVRDSFFLCRLSVSIGVSQCPKPLQPRPRP